MHAPANPFTAFCQKAFDFLEGAGVRHLVIGGLAVGAIGEARTTGDVDVIAFASPDERTGSPRGGSEGSSRLARRPRPR